MYATTIFIAMRRDAICSAALRAALWAALALASGLRVLLALARRHLPDDEAAVFHLAADVRQFLGTLLFLSSLLWASHGITSYYRG
jgi:hypothetical protein